MILHTIEITACLGLILCTMLLMYLHMHRQRVRLNSRAKQKITHTAFWVHTSAIRLMKHR